MHSWLTIIVHSCCHFLCTLCCQKLCTCCYRLEISVDTAVDVAKDADDMVLFDEDLEVLVKGIIEGRKNFANTMKYVFMVTSADF